MGNPFLYQSNLEESYLSDVFATIHRHNVPGVLEVRHEDNVKQVYISGGNVIHAASNERGDRLGAQLYRMGKLTREQLISTMREAASSDDLHGQLLIERGLLAPNELYEAIRAQMEAIVWSVFAWKQGEVRFKVGETDDDGRIKIHLPMRQVIIRGIKQVADTKALVARIGKKTTVFKPTYTTGDLIEIALEKEEYELLRLVNGERSFFEICNQGPFNMADNARLLYAFRLLDLIEADNSASLTTSGVMIRMGDKAI